MIRLNCPLIVRSFAERMSDTPMTRSSFALKNKASISRNIIERSQNFPSCVGANVLNTW